MAGKQSRPWSRREGRGLILMGAGGGRPGAHRAMAPAGYGTRRRAFHTDRHAREPRKPSMGVSLRRFSAPDNLLLHRPARSVLQG